MFSWIYGEGFSVWVMIEKKKTSSSFCAMLLYICNCRAGDTMMVVSL